jgi:iron complex transport system substrate-binding protein
MAKRIRIALLVGVLALSTTASMQSSFVDDAGRSVALPPRSARIFAAGAPAEVLLYTLAPELLVGRNRAPSGAALEFFPEKYRNPTLIRQLPEVDNPAADAELISLKPEIYIDYGTVSADYIESLDAVQRRTKVPGIILDGALAKIPETYRRVGIALGAPERGLQLSGAAGRLMAKYRDVLKTAASGIRVYVACSADGYVPCFADDSGGEQLAWLGGINVAGSRASSPRRPLTIDEIAALAPQVIVSSGSAARLRADPAWQRVDAVRAGRVHAWPALPYSWGARPPSVNRLPGLAWLAYVARGQKFDAGFEQDVRMFYNDFYHLKLSDTQMQMLVASP